MDRSIINLDNLSIGYRIKSLKKVIAHSLSAVIPACQLTCLIGLNGVGKSTLIRTLAGIQKPLYGKLLIKNQAIESYSKKKLSKIISIVLTEKVNIPGMSVYELVSLGRSPYTGFFGKLSSIDKTIVNEAIYLVRIESLINRFIQTLSDGEKQKAMIAKSLVQQTPIIFLDEPTAFLDFQSKIDIIQILHKICKNNGKTILFSTHDVKLALQIADVIWLMDKKIGLITEFSKKLCKNENMKLFLKKHIL